VNIGVAIDDSSYADLLIAEAQDGETPDVTVQADEPITIDPLPPTQTGTVEEVEESDETDGQPPLEEVENSDESDRAEWEDSSSDDVPPNGRSERLTNKKIGENLEKYYLKGRRKYTRLELGLTLPDPDGGPKPKKLFNTFETWARKQINNTFKLGMELKKNHITISWKVVDGGQTMSKDIKVSLTQYGERVNEEALVQLLFYIQDDITQEITPATVQTYAHIYSELIFSLKDLFVPFEDSKKAIKFINKLYANAKKSKVYSNIKTIVNLGLATLYKSLDEDEVNDE